MDVRKKLVDIVCDPAQINGCIHRCNHPPCAMVGDIVDALIENGVTVQECGEWVHPKGYVVSNGFLCSKCGHEEASYYQINPKLGGGCIADENGNFYHPPKMNYCPHCGAKMMSQPPKGE